MASASCPMGVPRQASHSNSRSSRRSKVLPRDPNISWAKVASPRGRANWVIKNKQLYTIKLILNDAIRQVW